MAYLHLNIQICFYTPQSILEKILVRAIQYGTARANFKKECWDFPSLVQKRSRSSELLGLQRPEIAISEEKCLGIGFSDNVEIEKS